MIRKLIRQMLAAQIFSALTVSLCLLIDNVMIGRYLGEQAIAAYGFSNPLLLAIGGIGSLLATGIQVACSKSLGKGSQEETNIGYSSAVAAAALISLVFAVAVILFRDPFATILGAGHEGGLYDSTRDYLLGFSIGAPGSMGALVLVPFLQMAGQSTLLIAAVLFMTAADVALDLLNVMVFHGGMFGMGLASALSYYAAMLVASFYFLSPKCVFHFSLKRVSMRKVGELFRGGVPAGFGMLASVICIFLMNHLLKGSTECNAVAAFTVISTIGNSANCITTGVGGVALTLSGILYHEEDRTGLRELIRALGGYSVILGLAMGAVLLVFAPSFISLLLPKADATQAAAILGLRLLAAGLIPCCVNSALKNTYQGTGREKLTVCMSLLEGAAFPLLTALVMKLCFGLTGAWLYFVGGELLMLCSLGLYIRWEKKTLPWRDSAFLMLRDDLGVTGDRLLELDIGTLEAVTAAVERAETFCRMHGQDTRIANHIAVCIEEMAANTIQHGFSADGREHHLSVRILCKEHDWVLRFRDDCGAFDPVHYVPATGKDDLGIRLMLAMASEAHYTYSLNLNNLTLRIRR